MRLPTTALPPGGEGGHHCATRVTAVEIHVDPETQDRIFVIHSEEQEPAVFAVAPIELAGILKDLAIAIAKSLH